MRFLAYLIFLSFTFISHADVRFLTISDFHYGALYSTKAAYDTDDLLLNLTLRKYEQLTRNVDFIITLGDFPVHSFGYDKNKVNYLNTVFHGLYALNTSKKPIFYITGNNDSLRGNYQPYSWNHKSAISVAADWKDACVFCEGLVVDKSHMFDGGYYSSYVIPNNKNIFLIALNSVQFANTPVYIPGYPHQTKDAIIQLQWFENQIKAHKSKQLIIAMHIPPGYSYLNQKLWKEQYLKAFLDILKQNHSQYEKVSLLTAHTHMDDIRKIELKKSTNIYAYATPGISRLHHNYPGMKIFTLNNNWQIKNYTTYYTTTRYKWGNEHYQAINPNGVFPQCLSSTNLVNCLDSLSDEMICQNLNKDLFYGVKGPQVNYNVCKYTFTINRQI